MKEIARIVEIYLYFSLMKLQIVLFKIIYFQNILFNVHYLK